jgi:hypothetical protein
VTIRRAIRLVVVAGALVACARALPPPGGEEDRVPPQIVATTPEALSVVPDFQGPVVFRFAEKLSERGATNPVIVSPQPAEIEFKRSGEEIRVELEGGWRPGVIYRVVLMPGVRDLFNNERRDPAELVFSTGPEIPSTAIAGLVTDRITGQPARQAIIDATRREDSLVYSTAADSLAFFALRNVPIGSYDIVAYSDLNNNRRRDPTEPVSRSVNQTLSRATDTVTVADQLVVVPPDTTAPRLARAEGRDSLQIRLFTDDWLEPLAPIAAINVRIRTLPDSTEVEGAHRLMHVDSFTAMMRERAEAALRDSLARAAAADTTVRDTTLRDTTGARQGGQRIGQVAGGQRIGGQRGIGQAPAIPPIGPLPYQELVLIPAAPLPPGRYLVEVSGLMNINQRFGGGGTAPFEIAEPRPPPRPDTGMVRRQ